MPIKCWFVLGAILVLLLFLGACAADPQPPGLTPIPSLAPGVAVTLLPSLPFSGPGVVGTIAAPVISATPVPLSGAQGAPVYELWCSLCHGNQGQGVNAIPLRNNSSIQAMTNEGIATIIVDGLAGTVMPAWLQDNGGPLTNVEINNVVAYIRSLQGISPSSNATSESASPTTTSLAANTPTSMPEGTRSAVSLTGDTNAGRVEFGLVCALCHGPEGVLGVPNPGSTDGTVPILNPIDPTLANADPQVFADNIDLFIEHGSVPAGPNPWMVMPSFGDNKLLTDQQVADVIAYIIQVNKSR